MPDPLITGDRDLMAQIDAGRARGGYLSVAATTRLNEQGNLVLDPFSTMIGTSVVLGSGNRVGEGGFTARTQTPGAAIAIGDHGRYVGGVSVTGRTALGSVSQILGAIAVDGTTLEPGDSYRDPDPDRRAGVLKGQGRARDLRVGRGAVIVGQWEFRQADMVRQIQFHPRLPVG